MNEPRSTVELARSPSAWTWRHEKARSATVPCTPCNEPLRSSPFRTAATPNPAYPLHCGFARLPRMGITYQTHMRRVLCLHLCPGNDMPWKLHRVWPARPRVCADCIGPQGTCSRMRAWRRLARPLKRAGLGAMTQPIRPDARLHELLSEPFDNYRRDVAPDVLVTAVAAEQRPS